MGGKTYIFPPNSRSTAPLRRLFMLTNLQRIELRTCWAPPVHRTPPRIDRRRGRTPKWIPKSDSRGIPKVNKESGDKKVPWISSVAQATKRFQGPFKGHQKRGSAAWAEPLLFWRQRLFWVGWGGLTPPCRAAPTSPFLLAEGPLEGL